MADFLQWDEYLFHLINSQWSFPLLDSIMPYWRSKFLWVPVYVFGTSFILLNFKRKGFYYLFLAILTIAFTDVCSSQWIKKNVQRERPCQSGALDPEVRLLVRCGSGYSFPSSHASNHFAIATFVAFTLGYYYRSLFLLLYCWAFSIAYGQIYVGLHYPSDVLAGAILGMLIGGLMSFFYWKLEDWQLIAKT